MAHADRPPSSSIDIDALFGDDAEHWDFLHAVRWIDCRADPRPRTGESKRPSEETVRLGQEPHTTFAPSNVAGFESNGPGRHPWLLQRFFGLFGPNGPLPLHLTEHARDRVRDRDDETFARFLDVFHHRMLEFFYRAWATARPTVSYDRPEEDRFGFYVASLIGLGERSLRDRDALDDIFKLHSAGRLSCQAKNAEGLAAMLADFFRFPTDVLEFVGHWVELPENCRCYLGVDPRASTLGENTTVGSHVWDCQQKFRIVFGPIDLETYLRLLPGRESLAKAVALVRNYVGDEFTWDLRLILKKEEVPPIQLGVQGHLGWTDWLVSGQPECDADDLVLRG
jgi:type VI secretion system protein ImpH